jgi:hypothetical protein
MLAAERLQVGSRVDVGHRRDFLVRRQHFGQFAPCTLDLGETGHVGHRTARRQVGKYGDLLGLGQDIRDLGHEMHAAEHDVLRFRLPGQLRQLQRIAGQVGMLVDVGALVMVAEHDHPVAEGPLGGNDARVAVLILKLAVLIEGSRGYWHGYRSG